MKPGTGEAPAGFEPIPESEAIELELTGEAERPQNVKDGTDPWMIEFSDPNTGGTARAYINLENEKAYSFSMIFYASAGLPRSSMLRTLTNIQIHLLLDGRKNNFTQRMETSSQVTSLSRITGM